jgi:hypothetical protein
MTASHYFDFAALLNTLIGLITAFITAVDPDELDVVVAVLEALPGVSQAFWSPSTEE